MKQPTKNKRTRAFPDPVSLYIIIAILINLLFILDALIRP